MENQFCFLNDKIVPLNEAFIHVTDIGLLRGFGIYEGITTYNSKPFMLKEHLSRFRRSAKALNILVPYSDEKILEIINELINLNKFPRTNLRVILTGGETLNGIEYNPEKPTFYILAEKHKPLQENIYQHGGSLVTYEHQRFMPDSKTNNYIAGVIVQSLRKKANALEILYVWQGKALECSTSNFFMVRGGIVITPKDNVLHGITRLAVLQLCKANNIPFEERNVSLEELSGADEVFISSSYKEIAPITEIDGKKVNNGDVGEITKKLMALFKKLY